MLLYLSEEAKLGIVSGAIAILILMVICMVCKLSRLHNKPAYRDSSYLKAEDKSTRRKVPKVRFPGFDADCSDCEQEKRAKINDDVYRQTSVPSPPKSSGTIKFSMIYQSNVQILLLNIIEANQLVGKDFWDTVDSYVKTRLQPDNEGTFRRQTQVVRKSKNPRFTENYEFHLSFKEVQNSTLYLSLWEIDKYSRHYMIGELQMKLDHVIKADESVAFNKELKCFQQVCLNRSLFNTPSNVYFNHLPHYRRLINSHIHSVLKTLKAKKNICIPFFPLERL